MQAGTNKQREVEIGRERERDANTWTQAQTQAQTQAHTHVESWAGRKLWGAAQQGEETCECTAVGGGLHTKQKARSRRASQRDSTKKLDGVALQEFEDAMALCNLRRRTRQDKQRQSGEQEGEEEVEDKKRKAYHQHEKQHHQ